ncbi:MAG: PASTA domain-containing protein [Pyrinomonadaceae bacterium]
MSLLQKSASAIGRLILVAVLAATFFTGMFGVVYYQLKGEEIEIPKLVGKNFNQGSDELAAHGLRIKKIASRFSEEKPNTILEQRPRAGTTGKTGLIISVVVSKPNPDGAETPVEVKDDEEAIEEIEDLPELKTDKAKKKARTKPKETNQKTRDVIDQKSDDDSSSKSDETPGGGDNKTTTKPGDPLPAGDKKNTTDKKNNNNPNPSNQKNEGVNSKPDKPKPAADSRPRRTVKDN